MKTICLRKVRNTAAVLLSVSATLMTIGCGMQVTSNSPLSTVGLGTSATVAGYEGTVLGGGIPVSGSTVLLWEAGSTGYGSPAKLVASATAPTSATGSFSFGGYTCPTDVSNPQLYVTVTGGIPLPTGNSTAYGPTGTNVPSIAMAAAIGPCSNFTSTTHITVNEVTTVGLVWALQQFIGVTPGTQLNAYATGTPSFTIGTSSTNLQGLANAFGWAQILAVSTSATAGTGGVSPGTSVYGTTVESAQVYTIADILTTCVNSTGSSSNACTTLFGQTKPVTNGTATNAPVDTLQAAYSMAINPLYNVQTLYAIIPPQTSFTPYTIFESTNPLTTCTSSVSPLCTEAINDFTVKVILSPGSTATANYGNYIANGSSIAFDSYGNAWLANSCHGAGTCYVNGADTASTPPSVTELSPTGVPIVPVGGSSTKISQFSVGGTAKTMTAEASYLSPFNVAVDTNNNVWVADYTDGYIFTVPGSVAAGGLTSSSASPTTGGTAALGGNGGANYGTGNSWASNVAAATTGTSSFPAALTIDGNNTVWFSLWGATNGTTYGTATRAIGGIPTTNGTAGTGTTVPTVPGQGFLATKDSSFTNSSVNIGGGTDTYQIAIDNFQSRTGYAGQSLIWAFDGAYTSCIGGAALQLFNSAATVGSNTITQGMATPFSTMVNAAGDSGTTGNCKTANQQYEIPAVASVNGYNAAAMAGAQGTVVDGLGNTWALNTTCVLSAVGATNPASGTAGYTGTCPANETTVTLSKLTPTYTYSATTKLSGSIAGSIYSTPSFLNIGATLTYSGGTWTLGNTSPVSSANAYLALDGANNLWMYGNNGFIEVNNAGVDVSSPYGFIGPSLVAAKTPAGVGAKRTLAIDPSGNVWSPYFTSNAQSIVVLVGQAAPTQVISVALKNGTVGSRP